MPFRSEKQRRYLWKNHPKIARDWTDEHGSKPQPKKKAEGGDLSIPKRVKGESIKGYIKRVGRSGKRNIKEYGLLPSRKEFKAVREEFAKRRREKSMGRKAEGGEIRKRHTTGRKTAYELANLLKGEDRLTQQDIKRSEKVIEARGLTEIQQKLESLKKRKALTDAQKRKAKERLKTPSYSKGIKRS